MTELNKYRDLIHQAALENNEVYERYLNTYGWVFAQINVADKERYGHHQALSKPKQDWMEKQHTEAMEINKNITEAIPQEETP